MCQELKNLAEDFSNYRGERKQVKYPLSLWDRAVQLCKDHPVKKISNSLRVSTESLRRHSKLRKNPCSATTPFIPIKIAPHPSIQLHVSGPLPMTIDFDRSIEELAKFILAIQGGLPC